jgi:hypothetical protein
MRHLRRLLVILTGVAMSCVAATTVAYAQVATRPEPGGGVVVYPPSDTSAADVGTPVWQFVAFTTLGALLAIAVVGLIYSLRHRRTSDTSEASEASRA